MKYTSVAFILFVIISNVLVAHSQFPARLSIPGAVLISEPKQRQQRPLQDVGLLQQLTRARRPQAPPLNSYPSSPAPIRPVIEEIEENDATSAPVSSSQFLENEAAKLGLSALRQQQQQEEEQPSRPVQFRPERPLPVLRSDIRETRPLLRQEPRPDVQLRQEIREEPVQRQLVRQQQPIRQQAQQQLQQPIRQKPSRSQLHQQQQQYADGDQQRVKKPIVQILRKYRTDNPDGSITWGYENEDGTFKEETLGVDCITRGKYGYVDPDGVKREYTYETGLKCDEPEEEEAEVAVRPGQGKKQQQQKLQPQPQQQQQQQQQYYRPQQQQY